MTLDEPVTCDEVRNAFEAAEPVEKMVALERP